MKRLVLILVLVFASVGFGDYGIALSTINGSGGTSAGGQYKLTGTIGQPHAEYSAAGNYALQAGFWTGGLLCIVDLPDFTIFAEYWLQTGVGLPADLNGDGVVDIYDLKLFADEWLCSCPYNWPFK